MKLVQQDKQLLNMLYMEQNHHLILMQLDYMHLMILVQNLLILIVFYYNYLYSNMVYNRFYLEIYLIQKLYIIYHILLLDNVNNLGDMFLFQIKLILMHMIFLNKQNKFYHHHLMKQNVNQLQFVNLMLLVSI